MVLYLLGGILKKLQIGQRISSSILFFGIIAVNVLTYVLYSILPELADRGSYISPNKLMAYTFPLHLYAAVLYVMLFVRMEFGKRIQKLIAFSSSRRIFGLYRQCASVCMGMAERSFLSLGNLSCDQSSWLHFCICIPVCCYNADCGLFPPENIRNLAYRAVSSENYIKKLNLMTRHPAHSIFSEKRSKKTICKKLVFLGCHFAYLILK